MAEKWERATDIKLIELWQAGLSIDGIAGQVGRTPSAVQSRASKLRLRRQPGDRSRYAPVTAEGKVYWTSADDDKLKALMKAKVGISDAALQLGRTPSAVETRWKRLSRPGSPRVLAVTTLGSRNCITCRGVFNREHGTNFMCGPCNSNAMNNRSQYD